MMSSLELVHMNGRVYDPLIGRMLSPDPIIQAPGNLQNYNRYGYVLNNPLKYTDPSGNSWVGDVAQAVAAYFTAGWSTVLWVAAIEVIDVYIETGDIGTALKAGVIAGASAYFTNESGDWFAPDDEGFNLGENITEYFRVTTNTRHGVSQSAGPSSMGFSSTPSQSLIGMIQPAVASPGISGVTNTKFANGAFSWSFERTTGQSPPLGWHPPLLLDAAQSNDPLRNANPNQSGFKSIENAAFAGFYHVTKQKNWKSREYGFAIYKKDDLFYFGRATSVAKTSWDYHKNPDFLTADENGSLVGYGHNHPDSEYFSGFQTMPDPLWQPGGRRLGGDIGTMYDFSIDAFLLTPQGNVRGEYFKNLDFYPRPFYDRHPTKYLAPIIPNSPDYSK